jgi:hypothetical protein
MRTTAACPKIIYEYIVHVRIMCYVKIRSEKNRRRLTTISICPCFIAVFALLFSIISVRKSSTNATRFVVLKSTWMSTWKMMRKYLTPSGPSGGKHGGVIVVIHGGEILGMGVVYKFKMLRREDFLSLLSKHILIKNYF